MTALQTSDANRRSDPALERRAAPRAEPPVSLEDAAGALQVLRHGGADDSTLRFDLPPAVKATVSPTIASLRWTAVLFGMLFGAARSAEGDLAIVVSTTIALFFTTWRSMLPLRLASERRVDRIKPITDGLLLGVAIGFSDGLVSPYAFCLLAAATVAAFGWGTMHGVLCFLVGLAATWATAELAGANPEWSTQPALGVVVGTLAAVLLAGFARTRLLEAERKRAALAGRVDTLAETNDLLHILNQVARTIPTALDLREALESTREQLHRAIGPDVLCILSTEQGDQWDAQVTDGCAVKPTTRHDDLPPAARDAVEADGVLRFDRLAGQGFGADSTNGIYAALRTRDRTVGILAVEARTPGAMGDSQQRLIGGLADVVALSIDNARWFGRLRTLGAEEERSRIARDLHDRIGQWLTYIGFEVERLASDEESDELNRLHGDVQTAIDELRETLRSLRTTVTADRPLTVTATEVIDRFTERRDIEVDFVSTGDDHLSVPVENELLRILQEALNNIDKHAGATRVDVRWDVGADRALLTIRDNGRGFDLESGVRDTAYGLVGMRERADAVGARLSIHSHLGGGTTISVSLDAADTEFTRSNHAVTHRPGR